MPTAQRLHRNKRAKLRRNTKASMHARWDACTHLVHARKQLGNDATLHPSVGVLSLAGNRVDFVQEDQRGPAVVVIGRGVEQVPNVGFRLP